MEHSEQIDKLMLALAQARGKFKPVLRRATNPYYQSVYAELEDYIDATKDGLSEAELAVLQLPVYNPEEAGVIITTFLGHSSGQYMLDRLWMPVSKPDAQGIGSAITYGRRYAYGGFLNVSSKGDDDDANAAVGSTQKDRQGAKSTDKNEKTGKTINEAQLRALWSAMKSSGRSEGEFREYLATKYGIEHSKEILKKDLDHILRWLMDVKPAPAPEPREPGDDDEPETAPLDFKVRRKHNESNDEAE